MTYQRPQWPPNELPATAHSADWDYLAEGGKSLLLRYVGDTDTGRAQGWLNHDKTRALALRLTKADRNDDAQTSLIEGVALLHRSAFERDVIEPLLKRTNLIPYSQVLTLDDSKRTFLDEIAAKIDKTRPMERKEFGQAALIVSVITAVEDITWFPHEAPALCLELKPKWLFGTGPVSRYRKHQVLKCQGEISLQVFEELYEPLDLISGIPTRIAKAAWGLVRDWLRGGNNLRVFVGGKTVVGHTPELFETLSILDSSDGEELRTLSERMVAILAQTLERPAVQSLLQRLSSLQARLAPLDVESLWSWWSNQTQGQPLGRGNPGSSDLTKEATVSEFADFARDWLYLDGAQGIAGSQEVALTLRKAVLGTLLSATFKDCSVFLRLIPPTPRSDVTAQQVHGGFPNEMPLDACPVTASVEREGNRHELGLDSYTSYPVEDKDAGIAHEESPSVLVPQSPSSNDGIPFGLTMRLIDMDPKPMHKLARWRDLDKAIETSFRQWSRRVGWPQVSEERVP